MNDAMSLRDDGPSFVFFDFIFLPVTDALEGTRPQNKPSLLTCNENHGMVFKEGLN